VIVAKFGGSSVRDAQAMRDCAKVVKATADLGVVIISATYNTTNELEKIYDLFSSGDNDQAMVAWKNLKLRHLNLAKELGAQCETPLENLLFELETKIKTLPTDLGANHRDLLLSFGESMSSLIFQLFLKEELKGVREVHLIPAPSFLKTDSNFGLARPKPESIKPYAHGLFSQGLAKGDLFVTQGFIGSDENDCVTTLGREGSDYSATLVAQALEANEVHIWTDVNGVYQTDPNIVAKAKHLPEISYDQAQALASAGAKVLFPKTLAPLRQQEIPLKVGRTKDFQGDCTWIKPSVENAPGLLGLTAKSRSDGHILTLVGDDVHEMAIEHSEIDRGDLYRSFFHQGGDLNDLLELWYDQYFC
jgi:aspartate kinase